MDVKKILIADDSEAIRISIKTALERHEYRIIEAKDGKETLIKAEKEQPHLIILDYEMPVMNGFEVYLCLRNSSFINKVPIIFCSGRLDIAGIIKPLPGAAIDFLIKPYNVSALVRMVETLII